MKSALGHLWLLGLSGSGKSTIGPALASLLHRPFLDTDAEITRSAGKTIAQIFQAEGETAFRQLETAVLKKCALAKPSIIACGGGIVIDPANRALLAQSGLRIYLQVPVPILAARLTGQTDRPLLPPDQLTATLTRQLAERQAFYLESEIQISVPHGTPLDLAQSIQQLLPKGK